MPSGRKRALAAAAVVAGLLAVSSYASPYWRLYQLRTAVAERDAAKVAQHVDFPALRESVKAELVAQLGAGSLVPQARDNPFAAFGKAMALAVIDPVVDAVVSPAGVTAMLEAGEVRIRREPDPAPAPGRASTDGEGDKVRYDLAYRSWDRVAMTREGGGSGAFILHRHGLWSWKLGGIELPRD
ncbi:DUF2939 domain-containing protein [Massilia consociata]